MPRLKCERCEIGERGATGYLCNQCVEELNSPECEICRTQHDPKKPPTSHIAKCVYPFVVARMPSVLYNDVYEYVWGEIYPEGTSYQQIADQFVQEFLNT